MSFLLLYFNSGQYLFHPFKFGIFLNRMVLPPMIRQWWFMIPLVLVAAFLVYLWILRLKRRVRDERILNYFATSLYGHNTVDDIFWDISKNCISKLNYTDCVIYQYDEEKKALIQKAAFGPKNPVKNEIFNPIQIPLGRGIVGSVAANRKGEIVDNTLNDKRYIIDDEMRLSEITVPIIVDGDLFGIIDSEHPKKNFYRKSDLRLLESIAAICAAKISKYLVQEKLRAAIARDLHDEMGSTLTSIHIISQLALKQSEGNELVTGHLQKIREQVGRMMESMSDIVWVINPYNDSLEKMVIRMKELASELFEKLQIEYDFITDEEVEHIVLDPEQRKDLFLIFKEAANNIAKYSNATKVRIMVTSKENLFQLEISDNGVGFLDSEKSTGNGLKNMKARARKIRGNMEIDSSPGCGTKISLTVSTAVQKNTQVE